MRYLIRYLVEADGRCQVLDFVRKHGQKFEARYFAYVDQLAEKGPTLPRPLADYLKDGIHELRLKHKGQIRILCFFVYHNYIVMSHAFVKKESAVPCHEIAKAIKNREKYLALVKIRTISLE
jgi:hypothetical protein